VAADNQLRTIRYTRLPGSTSRTDESELDLESVLEEIAPEIVSEWERLSLQRPAG